MKKLIIKGGLFFIAAFFFSARCNFALSAEPAVNDNWNKHWEGCFDIDLKYHKANRESLKEFLRVGKSWDVSVAAELKEINRVTEVTCKKWAENPNGSEPLEQFTREFAKVSLSALDLKKKADQFFAPRLKEWNFRSASELAIWGYRFTEFPCGRSFARTERYITTQVKAIESHLDRLRNKCPKAAEKVIANALKKGESGPKHQMGDGGPAKSEAEINNQRHPASGSDISGTTNAIDEANRAKKILQEQK